MVVIDWILGNGGDLQVVLFFVFLATLLVVERLVPKRPGTLDRRRRWPANFALTAINLAALSVLPISLIGAGFWAQQRGFGLLNLWPLGPGPVVVATLLYKRYIPFYVYKDTMGYFSRVNFKS